MAKDILVSLGIAAAASVIDAEIQKQVGGFGATVLIISNEKKNDIV